MSEVAEPARRSIRQDAELIFRTTFLENPYLASQTVFPKQFIFLTIPSLEMLFGGGAGGGKSKSLLFSALQYAFVPGYRACIIRRSLPDLKQSGGIIEQSHEILRNHKDAQYNFSENYWRFGSGARLDFKHLADENDKQDFQGGMWQFCVGKGTPILMADGKYKPIQSVVVGDMVETMQGPRKVQRTHSPGKKICYRITTKYSSTIISEDHRILTDHGWVSPREQISIGCHAIDSKLASSAETCRRSLQPPSCSLSDRTRVGEPSQRLHLGNYLPETVASTEDNRTDCELSYGERQASPPPVLWSCLAMLHAPSLRLVVQGNEKSTQPCAQVRAGDGSSIQDFPTDCPIGCDSCGERFRRGEECDQSCTPLQGDAAAQRRTCLLADDRPSIQERTQSDGKRCYHHPYTSEERNSFAALEMTSVEMVPAGEVEVYDLTIQGESHYISYGGIVSSNCGFDELTQFPENHYLYVFSRLRKIAINPNERKFDASLVPLRMRATSNPGGVGHKWVYDRFVNVKTKKPGTLFVPSLAKDNPFLDQESYQLSLSQLDRVTRRQLQEGDWTVTPSGGIFYEEYFKYRFSQTGGRNSGYYDLNGKKVAVSDCIRFAAADIAGTEKTSEEQKRLNDPDFTVIGIWDRTPDGELLLIHLWRGQQNIPEVEEKLAELYSQWDVQYAAVEKNGIGLPVVQAARRRGLTIKAVIAKTNKEARAQSASILMENGQVWFPYGAPWFEALKDEMLQFPVVKHDDQTDMCSIACQQVSKSLAPRRAAPEVEKEASIAKLEDETREKQKQDERKQYEVTAHRDYGWTEIA